MKECLSVKEKIKRAIERHSDWTDYRIAKVAGASVHEVRFVRTELKGKSLSAEIDLEKLKKMYDIKERILEELKKIPRGKLVAEFELCSRIGCSMEKFRKVVARNEEDLRKYRLKLRLSQSYWNAAWFWGAPEDIEEARRIQDGL